MISRPCIFSEFLSLDGPVILITWAMLSCLENFNEIPKESSAFLFSIRQLVFSEADLLIPDTEFFFRP
jgi:hypothetical protein